MRLESVQALKQELQESFAKLPLQAAQVRRFSTQSGPGRSGARIGLGIQGGQRGNYILAVRVQEASSVDEIVAKLPSRARKEADVRVTGLIFKQQPWYQKKISPLKIGVSVGHVAVTAGTLGCFVSRNGDGRPLILSNNHVLADENRANIGDLILQPGKCDGGMPSRDGIARLMKQVRLKKDKNFVDAALAAVEDGIPMNFATLTRLGKLSGVREDLVDEGEPVFKIGRTTGLTEGRVSAFDMDISVEYDSGFLNFNGQIEITRTGRKPFSKGGDSGSLIVDGQGRAVGLLFAGNDKDVTYANPIAEVTKALKVQLLF